MKNTIKYFYNISAIEIIKCGDNYKISDNNANYYLTILNTDLSLLNYIYKFLISHNIYCHEIILNKDSAMVTKIDDKEYVLLKTYVENKKIDINDINNYTIYIDHNKCNWYALWSKKLDYYVYQMSQFKKKYPLLYQSFSYYNGLCETAISLINNSNISNVNIYINHKRINKNFDYLEFYNPVNLILDVKIRDACEYFKSCFFYKKDPIDELVHYINYVPLSNEEAILFLTRMLYPSYYFDLYDLIIQGKEKEEKIELILNKTTDYEAFLIKIYNLLYYKYSIPEVEWLIKT